MSSYRYSSDEDDLNIRVSRRAHASPPYDYVEPPRRRPASYYPGEQTPSYLYPERGYPERTVIRARSKSRERRRPSPPSPPQQQAQPVVIQNHIYRDHSDDEDDYRQLQVARPSRQRSSSRGPASNYMTREEYELERTRQQVEDMRLANARDRDDRRVKDYRDDVELKNAKRELDEIKAREQRAKDEARMKREMELERLREEEREAEEKEKRDKEAKAAVEKYKREELERIAKEKKAKEQADAEYERRLREQLSKSGLDTKQIEAVIQGKKVVPEAVKQQMHHQMQPQRPAAGWQVPPPPPPVPVMGNEIARPTYTRMARKHLSIETLRTYHIDFDYDTDTDYVLIKRWVPEWEQDTLWRHTRELRDKRSESLYLDVGEKKRERRRSRDPQFEWVRKKESSRDRRRSKSPGVLMYLAGARPV